MTTTTRDTSVTLARDTNQALGIGQFACDFMGGRLGDPDRSVLDRTLLFFTDSVVCGLSAIALGTNAPRVLREEALIYTQDGGVPIFGSAVGVAPEKAIVANCAAVREWDSNGTNFGYNPTLGHTAGEFGHNDFYPVCVAAAQRAGHDGAFALRGMVLLDEIRGRLAEVFSLKTYKIDHVVHGAIASAAAYGAMLGATPEQIESAIGMSVSHFIPWRAIRAGKQLSDSKGASAAISTEAAVVSMQRAMRGFAGPADVFRNPEAIFRVFEGPGQLFVGLDKAGRPVPVEQVSGAGSPFDLVLSHAGEDFAVMGMHFKLGLYEHQSAGALHGLIDLVVKHPDLIRKPERIESIKIVAYEPAFSIIGDPAKRDPRTRQSADHSMVYIVARTLQRAIEVASGGRTFENLDEAWKRLMLVPDDYRPAAIMDSNTRAIMELITFEHGGPEYDAKYPDGIPTSVVITAGGEQYDSGLVMYPTGHSRNHEADLDGLLRNKWQRLATEAVGEPERIIDRFQALPRLSNNQLRALYDFEIRDHGRFD